MLSFIIQIVSIYLFIFMGFMAKKQFKSKIDEKSLVLISVYYLQPILTFWGLTRKEIDGNILLAPFLYIIIVLITMFILIFIAKISFDNKENKSILIASSLIGNTGNLGIPIGIALFGEESAAYTSIINIANLFFVYIVGVYFFARDKFSFKEGITNIFKIPIIWVAIVALIFNFSGFTIHKSVDRVLEMGAYSAIVIQLMIFGMYLGLVKIKELNFKLNSFVVVSKLILLPAIGFVFLSMLGYSGFIFFIIMLQLFMPLAVSNINLSALYNCNPIEVTGILLTSSIVFFILSILYVGFVK